MRKPTVALTAAMSAAGFELRETGGGCDAWIRENTDENWGAFGSVWITETSEARAPQTLSAPAALGVYGDEPLGAPIALFTFPNVRTALRWLVSNSRA
jgi:hypothetical protein